jgi:hypothetical protein
MIGRAFALGLALAAVAGCTTPRDLALPGISADGDGDGMTGGARQDGGPPAATTSDAAGPGGVDAPAPVPVDTNPGPPVADARPAGGPDAPATPSGCGACAPPEHAQATCTDGGCGFLCDSGYHRCDSRCVGEEDPQACGSRCIACPLPGAGQRAICASGSCGKSCASGFVSCPETGALCKPVGWTFENGQTGWFIRDGAGGPSQVRAHGGTTSVATKLQFAPTPDLPDRDGRIELTLCAGNTNLAGRTLSAWIYIDGPEIVPFTGTYTGTSYCLFGYLIAAGNLGGPGTSAQTGTWFRITDTVAATTQTPEIQVSCFIHPRAAGSWIGTIYFDDVTIE